MAKTREVNYWTKINSDEALEKFLEHKKKHDALKTEDSNPIPPVLVLDVFEESFAPCTMSLHGTLERTKAGLVDSNLLQLATCNVTKIEKLERFRGRSQPTIILCSHGKVIDLMYGANIPLLLQKIQMHLKVQESPEESAKRPLYEFDEPLPFEKEEIDKINAIKEEAKLIKKLKEETELREMMDNVIELMNENVNDHGVTLFMPHVMSSAYKSTSEIAKRFKLFSRARKVIRIQPDMLPLLNYKLENPFDEDVLNYLIDKELLAALWSADPDQPAEFYLNQFVRKTTEPIPRPTGLLVTEDEENIEIVGTPILESLTVYLDECIKETSETDINDNEVEKEPSLLKDDSIEDIPSIKSDSPNNTEEERAFVVIPPIWTPANQAGNAMFMFVFFQKECEHFLPQVDEPEPPHICFIFPASKRVDVLEKCKEYPKEVLAYGFFTSDDLENAQLICKSVEDYEKHPQRDAERIIMKIAKRTSHCELALGTLTPLYLSHNTSRGGEDCALVFNQDFYSIDDKKETEEQEHNNQLSDS